ncbi:MAG TPA: prepilin-type N-terminal cleavage/methylation domain-containing protein [Opitutaceae bacterium]|nr:prepilin-type N-terminal cleavage/methylation domain-containing protein [Opitutaceae bacterium]
MSRPSRRKKKAAGFTLVEVMITMFLISMMCLSVFAALQQITKNALSVALRDEAYHLMQAQAEQLLEGTYADFVPTTADQTINSSVKTSYLPSFVNSLTQLSTNQAANLAGRISYTRRVVSVASDSSSTTLRVEVSWTWQGRPELVSTLLYRSSAN